MSIYSNLQHGADIITTASYQTSIPGFQKHLGVTEERGRELIELSVELAKKARDDFVASNTGNKRSHILKMNLCKWWNK